MLYTMASESGGVPEDWRSDVIVPLYRGKGERTECRNIEVSAYAWLENYMQGFY